MSLFFSDQNLILGSESAINGQEARHLLQSRRIKIGERIKLQGQDGKRFLAEIVGVTKTEVAARPIQELPAPAEPTVTITLLQSFVAEQALDMILQKATELGAHNITIFPTVNSPHRLSKDQIAKKLPRWQKIVYEATKQCERPQTPTVSYINAFNEAVDVARGCDKSILLDVNGISPLSLIPHHSSLALLVGPEGGFTEEEIGSIKSLPNPESLSLGPYILRAETAAIAALAVVQAFGK